ncbi:uncharacterized protein LOC109535466 [Dendroctonus ponderosae]|uniref:uncharacterized protein LOC109535466 n=1 Tax=Dendroctonus ponderosae TaxID=77166 RepID=UPI0020364125|nr:uncharacterized protein LOC109535466 [Dendroctonus ponderosae]KAH1027680.1 hypothetical protein HUJ05_001144 [Dendroctonus ponderosae]
MKMDDMIQDPLGDPAESGQSSPFESGACPVQSNMWCNDIPALSPAQNANVLPGYSADQQQFFFSPTSQQIPSPMCFGSSRQTTEGGQFHFQFNNYGFSEHNTKMLLGKRKSNLPPPQPCKQLVTDEQMAEHMSKLHINSQTQLLPIEPDSVKNKRLYMCEEMRKLQDPIMTLLPPGLLKHQPCTALVLWQPPQSRIIPSLNSCLSTSFKDADKGKIEANKTKPSTSNLLDYECLDNKFDGSMELDS